MKTEAGTHDISLALLRASPTRQGFREAVFLANEVDRRCLAVWKTITTSARRASVGHKGSAEGSFYHLRPYMSPRGIAPESGGVPACHVVQVLVRQAILSCECYLHASEEGAPRRGLKRRPCVHLQLPYRVFHPLLQAVCHVYASDEVAPRRCQKRRLMSIFGYLIRCYILFCRHGGLPGLHSEWRVDRVIMFTPCQARPSMTTTN